MSKEEFLRPPFKGIECIDLSAFSGDSKEFRVDSNSDIISIEFGEEYEVGWNKTVQAVTEKKPTGTIDVSPNKQEPDPDYKNELRKRGWTTE